jgi:hypothetical protein
MELRDHRLMSYRCVPNWPPVWVRRKSAAEQVLRGELGILQQVITTEFACRRSFLLIEHEGLRYMGCLIFSDTRFCRPIVKLLVWPTSSGTLKDVQRSLTLRSFDLPTTAQTREPTVVIIEHALTSPPPYLLEFFDKPQ